MMGVSTRHKEQTYEQNFFLYLFVQIDWVNLDQLKVFGNDTNFRSSSDWVKLFDTAISLKLQSSKVASLLADVFDIAIFLFFPKFGGSIRALLLSLVVQDSL